MSDHGTEFCVSPDEADPKSGSTFIVGGVGIALLVVVALLLEVLFHRTAEAESYRKFTSQQPEQLRQVQAEQLERIKGYRWVDQKQGVVAIPIERAMRLVIDEDADRRRSLGRRGE